MRPGGAAHGPWGMLEPVGGQPRTARDLDVVFLPLVGFDAAGHRIGMGKGFYDRHFAHRLPAAALAAPAAGRHRLRSAAGRRICRTHRMTCRWMEL